MLRALPTIPMNVVVILISLTCILDLYINTINHISIKIKGK